MKTNDRKRGVLLAQQWEGRSFRSWLLLLIVALAMTALVGCKPKVAVEPERLVVRVARAKSLAEMQQGKGSAYVATVKGRNETTLSFKVGGIVDLIGPKPGEDWQEGAAVNAGQLLAQLKQSDFTNALNSARAKEELDRTLSERAERLLKEGAVSQQEYDSARAARIASESTRKQREQDLADSRLLAPLNGNLLARHVNSGETIAAGRPALQIADLRELEVEVGVPDRVVGRVTVGSEIPVEFWTLQNRRFTGRVKEVGVAAREGGRLFRVVITLDNAELLIRPGMTASVYLEEKRPAPPGAVLVPLSALVSRNENALAVFVVGDDQCARERRVKTDEIIKSSVVVTEGLQPGEWVVVAGASFLYDGAPVRAQADDAR